MHLNLTIVVSYLVSWCFNPSQPQRITSELRETFTKRHIVERTNKAEIRPKEQSGKAESCQKNLWNEIQLKGPHGQKQTQRLNKKEWASLVGLCQRHKPQHLHRLKVSPWGPMVIILILYLPTGTSVDLMYLAIVCVLGDNCRG